MHFSLQYFEKLGRELEGAGYEVTEVRRELEATEAEEEISMMWADVLYSEPVGCFFVSDCLKGECFVFLEPRRACIPIRQAGIEAFRAKRAWLQQKLGNAQPGGRAPFRRL
jgi:hypothetical protein